MKPRLLITGANGLIGGILIPHLAGTFEICGLDLSPSPAGSAFRRADIAESSQVRSVFDEFSPIDFVVHLAANPSADADWPPVLRNNIHGTWNVFSLSSEFNVRRIVFASSNHATGYYEGVSPALHLQASLPAIDDTFPVRPDGPYGISKLAGEAIARYFYDCCRLEAVCLRIGSVLPDDDPRGDDRHRSTWLSHRDLRRLVERSLLARDGFPGFGIYYGVSNNARRFWDISKAGLELGYQPQDDASKFLRNL